jgi:gliding motility-associated-like protein
MDSMVLVNGNVSGYGGYGGAISINGTGSLFIHNSFITGNNATLGGGISSRNNSGASDQVEIQNSSITNNTASSSGGGIYSFSSSYSSSVQVTNSTISGNSAGIYGGGIYSFHSSFQLTNTTISGNSSNDKGGGIYSVYGSSVQLTNSTLIGNSAGNSGGGITNSNSSNFTFESSIVWTEASDGTNTENGYQSFLNFIGYNIFSNAPSGYNSSLDLVNISASDLNLQPLANNGGSTQTMLPGCGSAAINAGGPSDFSAAQNGAITDVRRDIGAAESPSSPPSSSSFSVSECTSYTVPSGNLTISGPNTQIINDTIPNACGGDSIMTITVNFVPNQTRLVMNNNDSGINSLRQIVADACSGDTIRFDPSLISSGSDSIVLTSNIAFSKSLIFKGLYNSTDTLFISGGNTNRHFDISNAGNVAMDSMVLVNGNAGWGDGGAIQFDSSDSLFVHNSIISGNNGSDGGGIYSSTSAFSNTFSSHVQLLNSTIRNNTALRDGGGVFSSSIHLINSTFSDNIARNGGAFCTYSNNSFVKVINSTINTNTSNLYGGAFYSLANDSSFVEVTNSTIIGNNASGGDGGGIFCDGSNYSLIEITSSIIWTASSGGSNIFNDGDPIISNGYNIFSDAPNGHNSTLDLVNVSAVNLNLQPLANNGGTTQTMLPGCGSLAINAGTPADLSVAQNGAITDPRRDAGAAEYLLTTSITCPSDTTVFANAGQCTFSGNFGTATANNNCSPIINDAPVNLPLGNTTVVWKTTDVKGDTISCSQIVTVIDNQDPVITCPTDITINTDAGLCTSTSGIGTATATDNCSVTITDNAPANFPIGNTTVTYTATDGSGNSVTCTQIVTVEDNENPVITCPADITINTDAGLCTSTSAIGTATATDNCSVTITNDAPVSFPIGNTSVTYTATDGSGNVVTCTQVVTVIDNENPVITCPTDITINTDAGLCTSTSSIGAATATDNCSVTITDNAPANFPIGNTTVTYTATDGSGNSVTCTQIVTVEDNENPVITCPTDITINTDAGLCTSTSAIGSATATDNCSVTITNDAPASFPIGNTTVTYTATDGSGNSITCTQVVTVIDIENPVITCPTDITLNTDAGLCTSTSAIGTATATDNCSVTITDNAPANFPIGNTTVTYTATDGSGNSVTCIQVVIVIDAENPTITCPADIIVYADENCEFSLPDYTLLAISNDNCTALPTITQSPAIGSILELGNYIITLTTTDNSGNNSNCTFEVSVLDTISPIVNCLAGQTEILDEYCQFVIPDYSLMTDLTDNCDDELFVTQFPEVGTVYDGVQNLPITLTFEDASGNITTCYFKVEVITDGINPGCLEDIVITTLLTPNGDGRNDTWIVRELDFIKDCTVQVFNRWGQKVYEATNYQNDWNGEYKGEPLPDGAYVYVIICNDKIKYSGPLTIMSSSN